jgi:hypothetical protein
MMERERESPTKEQLDHGDLHSAMQHPKLVHGEMATHTPVDAVLKLPAWKRIDSTNRSSPSSSMSPAGKTRHRPRGRRRPWPWGRPPCAASRPKVTLRLPLAPSKEAGEHREGEPRRWKGSPSWEMRGGRRNPPPATGEVVEAGVGSD